MKLYSVAGLAAALLLFPVASFAAPAAAADTATATPPSGGASDGSAAPSAPVAADLPVNPFVAGEQMIGIAAGAHIPAFILPVTGGGVSNLGFGGSLSFSYQYFLSRGLAVGGNIAGSYNGTIGGLSFFSAPLGATIAYWWTKVPLEFSLLAEAGGYIERYNGKGMFGAFAKAGGGAYWRISPAWSLGLQAYLWFMPELHYAPYTDLSQYSGFVETSLAVVYHL